MGGAARALAAVATCPITVVKTQMEYVGYNVKHTVSWRPHCASPCASSQGAFPEAVGYHQAGGLHWPQVSAKVLSPLLTRSSCFIVQALTLNSAPCRHGPAAPPVCISHCCRICIPRSTATATSWQQQLRLRLMLMLL